MSRELVVFACLFSGAPAVHAAAPPSSFEEGFDDLAAPSFAGADPAGGDPGGATASSSAGPERASQPFGDDPPGYKAGRGLITLEGVSGMFLNPTSGTLPAGSLTAQYCAALLDRGATDAQHTAMLSYGITDWFELGVLGRINDPDEGPTIGGGGPLARMRLLTEEGWIPELSVGGMLREGNERIDKRTVFVAASKRLAFEENPLLFSVRGHAGFRQIWQNSDVNEANGSIVYGGIEVELPYDVYLVGELSTRDDVFEHHPFSFGLQWRPTHVVGLSIAGVQTGGEESVSFYIGIGVIHTF